MQPIVLMIREALSSKKFIMTMASVVAAAAMKIGLDLPTETVATVLTPVVAYVLAQGWADRGKEAAKVAGTVDLARLQMVENTPPPPEAVKEKLV